MNKLNQGRERGAILVVGLLLLLVMTLIGVTAMKSSTLDEKITANAQFKMLTYQAAESGLEQAWDQGLGALPVTTVNATTTLTLADPSLDIGIAGATADITVIESYVGSAANPVLPGYSLGAGYTGFFFDIDSQAVIPESNARSTHRRGAVVIN